MAPFSGTAMLPLKHPKAELHRSLRKFLQVMDRGEVDSVRGTRLLDNKPHLPQKQFLYLWTAAIVPVHSDVHLRTALDMALQELVMLHSSWSGKGQCK